MVRKIFDGKSAEGELDECGLTMQELAKIREAFIPILVGIHHQRTRPQHLFMVLEGVQDLRHELHVGNLDQVGKVIRRLDGLPRFLGQADVDEIGFHERIHVR